MPLLIFAGGLFMTGAIGIDIHSAREADVNGAQRPCLLVLLAPFLLFRSQYPLSKETCRQTG